MVDYNPHRSASGFQGHTAAPARSLLSRIPALILLAALVAGGTTGCATGPQAMGDQDSDQERKWAVEQNFRQGRPNWETSGEMGYYGPVQGWDTGNDPFGPGPM